MLLILTATNSLTQPTQALIEARYKVLSMFCDTIDGEVFVEDKVLWVAWPMKIKYKNLFKMNIVAWLSLTSKHRTREDPQYLCE